MIQLKKTSVTIDQEEVELLRSAFAENHGVLLRGLLEPDLLKFLAPRLDQQPWVRRRHEGIGADDVLNDGLAVGLLNFATNSPAFLDAIRRISGCADVVFFKGSVYRLMPDSEDHDSWHSDIVARGNTRLVGMSINLGARGYSGGVLQIRSADSGKIGFEIANTGWGDAILFAVSGDLKHRVTDVTGGDPRVAFAGWFCAGTEDYFASLRRPGSFG